MSWYEIVSMTMPSISISIATVAAGIAVICNLPLKLLLPSAEKATLKYLADATLQKFDDAKTKIKEAAELSSLEPELSKLNIPLYAVVHEEMGVRGFQPFFKGEILLDINRKFYGPKERRTLLLGLFRISVWRNMYRAWKNGYSGNLKGDGTLLGGVFVLDKGMEGILFEHREEEFGDKANVTEVLLAARKIVSQ